MDVVQGIVTQFKGNGRQFGYPTANITVETDHADGIYFGYADLGPYVARPALIFIGVPITVGDTARRVEVHVLDIPDQDYYGEHMAVHIAHFHRPNEKFADVDTLLAAMAADEAAGRAWLANAPKREDT